uniref:Coiled-coil-domain-containing protein 138 coiled-coil domain-containing protein n=1 Tax=Ciona savignyi TaxID=51511 RepID=H2YZK9_CIOSA
MEDQLNSCSQTDSDYDPYVEHLRRKYLQSTVCTEGSTALSSNSNVVLNDDCSANFMECSPSSSLTASEKQHYQQAMNDLRRLLQKGVKPDTSPQKQEFNEDETDNITPVQDKDTGFSGLDHTLINSTTLPTLPSDITSTTAQNYTGKSQKSVRISLDPTMLNEHDLFEPRSILRSHKPSTDVQVIHNELINIHKKLNVKSHRLAEERAVLEEREHELEMREESVRMREDALAEEEASVRREHEVMIRLQGVESEVQEKFEILREHHSDEMNRVSAALTDKLKDMKRLKNSFDIIKTQNDDIKQQVCELTQQNKKLTSQN